MRDDLAHGHHPPSSGLSLSYYSAELLSTVDTAGCIHDPQGSLRLTVANWPSGPQRGLPGQRQLLAENQALPGLGSMRYLGPLTSFGCSHVRLSWKLAACGGLVPFPF